MSDPYDWLPPRLWECPRGCGTCLLREQKCPKCGATEGM